MIETGLWLIPILEPIRPDLEQVEALLASTVAGVEGPLGPVLRGAVRGGKRLRPALVILAGRLFAASGPPFHTLAAAMDLLHSATLIHDDLLDGSALRRGREAIHATWPANAAVLAGDYLLAQAISLIAELGHPRLLRLFGAVLRAVCAGEIRQALGAGGCHVGREGYLRSIEAKTGSLFAACAEMAGVLAGAHERQIASLRRFGCELGIAYQIVDDVLDIVADGAALGKPAGSDLRQGLITLPVLCYLERAEDDEAVSAVLSGQRDEARVHSAVEAIRTSGAVEAALAEAEAHARLSRVALADLPDGPARQALHGLVDYVVQPRG